MIKPLLILMFLALAACQGDESVSKFTDPEAEYQLAEIDDAPFTALATISFPEEGRVEGQAPCNRYFATQTAPYPWFALEGIGATRMACENLAAESAFFAALEVMTLSEVQGGTLILSNVDGRSMVFKAR
ncbi:META domain-containing protein [Octadecabacter sp. 1_MG-2023]|uniref:META domain-containing protein n=1 Tax=unclassified Octadecabacter TaxID=196158 RepID=UPI001C09612B|nr:MULTISPECIES: META domain-containing protein [unclassified Octadecabacter]MBU2992615.1 META domain-containing protein [Octadecabacter sp. B2R22]MDO6734628.1 META domain-containing protein [Octadecabacter sp. 1_MG-2023]